MLDVSSLLGSIESKYSKEPRHECTAQIATSLVALNSLYYPTAATTLSLISVWAGTTGKKYVQLESLGELYGSQAYQHILQSLSAETELAALPMPNIGNDSVFFLDFTSPEFGTLSDEVIGLCPPAVNCFGLVNLSEVNGRTYWYLIGNRYQFSGPEFDCLLDNFSALLNVSYCNSDHAICKIGSLSKTAIAAIREQQGNDASSLLEGDVYSRFLDIARLERDKIAVRWLANDIEMSLTFGGLEQKVNSISSSLQLLGVAQGVRVVVHMQRSPELVATILSILRLHAVYVPADHSLTNAELSHIVHDADASLLVIDSVTAKNTGGIATCQYCPTEDWEPLVGHDPLPAYIPSTPEHTSFIFYTSGSTGRPKGVQHGQFQLLNRIEWCRRLFPVALNDCFGQRTMIGFLPSLFETFVGLLSGCTLAIFPDGYVKDPKQLIKGIKRFGITHFSFVPSILNELLKLPSCNEDLRSLKLCISAGEVLSKELLKRFEALLPDCVLVNDYGSTETNGALYFSNRAESADLHFTPVSNVAAFVLNELNEMSPFGLPGELAFAGDVLSHGYVDSSLDATKFLLLDIYKDGTPVRVYKSGDLGIALKNNAFIIKGRTDRNVKINGVKVDLNGLELTLKRILPVNNLAVVCEARRGNSNQLVAFVHKRQEASLDLTNVRDRLLEQLPLQHVPTRFLEVQEIPKTKSGKTDYQNLIKMARSTASNLTNEDERVYTGTTVEKLRMLVSEIVGVQSADIDESKKFYAIGLDSISIIRLLERLNGAFACSLTIADLYNAATISDLAILLARLADGQIAASPGDVPNHQLTGENEAFRKDDHSAVMKLPVIVADKLGQAEQYGKAPEVAVLGVSCRLPGADNTDEFWKRLKSGDCAFTSANDLEDWRWTQNNGEGTCLKEFVVGRINNARSFDHEFFNISPVEARLMDPQQRILLEECWKALEDGGIADTDLEGKRVSIFVGARQGDYLNLTQKFAEESTAHALMGTDTAIQAARLSYHLNLKGASVTIDTACSSSMVALHLARHSLLLNESDIAIVCGVHILSTRWLLDTSHALGMLSERGVCAPFDNEADGIVVSEGAVAMLLTRSDNPLATNREVYGYICASAVNQDGRTNGITAPSGHSQEMLLESVYDTAEDLAAQVSYIETHGTGTKLGDPIEFTALNNFFSKRAGVAQIKIGSVKANVGHTIACSGLTSVLKVLLCMRHAELVAQPNYKNPNRLISELNSLLAINTESTAWQTPAGRLVAGINAFGFSGTNAHVVVKSAVHAGPTASPARVNMNGHLIILSAKSDGALDAYVEQYRAWLEGAGESLDIADIAYSVHSTRSRFKQQLAIVCSSVDELKEILDNSISKRECNRSFRFLTEPLHLMTHISSGAPARYQFDLPDLDKQAFSAFDFRKFFEKIIQQKSPKMISALPFHQVYSPLLGFQILKLPIYPFTKTAHWIGGKQVTPSQKTLKSTDAVTAASSVTKSAAQQQENLKVSFERVQDWLTQLISKATGFDAATVTRRNSFDELGIDSTIIAALTHSIRKLMPQFSAASFFQFGNLRSLAEHMLSIHPEAVNMFTGALTELDNMPAKLDPQTAPHTVDQPLNAQLRPDGLSSLDRPFPITDNYHSPDKDRGVAIIGLSGRYPAADDLQTFWDNLVHGKDCITEIPVSRWKQSASEVFGDGNPSHLTRWGGLLDQVDKFDARFFGISPKEAISMDPQERMMLQTVYHLLEDAGLTKQELQPYKVGVFMGVSWSDYHLLAIEQPNWKDQIAPNRSFATIANRISYHYNFTGPSFSVDSMCSSSLTAAKLAWDALHSGEIDFAVVGSANICLHLSKYHLLDQGRFLSPDGRCRSFAEGGAGYVPGEGVAALLLCKPELTSELNANVYGLLRSIEINHGGKTNGYSVPSPGSQSEVIERAIANAGITAEDISYMEAHGTGTALGDPIEVEGLSKAFRMSSQKTGFCALGSVKSLIGHLEACAGLAGLTKILLQMKHRMLVPTIHCEQTNSFIDFENSPFVLQRSVEKWSTEHPQQKMIAGLSSFGAGGANAHLIVESASLAIASNPSRVKQVFVFSAKTEEQLHQLLRAHIAYLLRFEPPPGNGCTQPAGLYEQVTQMERDLLKAMGVDGSATDYWQVMTDQCRAFRYALHQLVVSRLSVSLPFDLMDGCASLYDYIDRIGTSTNQATRVDAEKVDFDRSWWNDYAYTLQTGREAHDERICVIVSSPVELKEKLSDYLTGVNSGNVVRCSFGGVRSAMQDLTADSMIYENRASALEETLQELAGLWAIGKKVNWSVLYNDYLPKRISIPLMPFRPVRFWITDQFDEKVDNKEDGNGKHLSGIRFRFDNGTDISRWLLHTSFADHVVMGKPIVPAAAFISLFLSAAKSRIDTKTVALQNIKIKRPLELLSDKLPIIWEQEQSELRLVQKESGTNANLIASASLANLQHPLPFDDLNLGQCSNGVLVQKLSRNSCYQLFEEFGLIYGPQFQTVQYIDVYDQYVLGKVAASEMNEGKSIHFELDPQQLDGCFQVVVAATRLLGHATAGSRFLPNKIKNFVLYHPLPSVVSVFVQKHPYTTTEAPGTIEFNVGIYSDDGRLCAAIEGFSIQQIQSTPPHTDNKELHFLVHKPKHVPWEQPEAIHEEPVLMICDNPVSSELLLSAVGNKKLITFKVLRDRFDSCKDLEDDESLAASLSSILFQGNWQPESIILQTEQLFQDDQPLRSLEDLRLLFILLKAVLANPANSIRQFIFVANQNSSVNPHIVALSGLFKSLNLEQAAIRFRKLSIAENDPHTLQICIARELTQGAKAAVETLVSNGNRFEYELVEVQPSDPLTTRPIQFKDNCNYLISGGLGKIGVDLLNYIRSVCNATLIVIGSRPPELVNEQVLEISQGLGDLHYYQADLKNATSVSTAVARILQNHGDLHGVINCAGVTNDRFFAKKPWKEFLTTISPKVYGTVLLDACLKNQPLSFFVNYSSISGAIGSSGQTDYGFANSFLDGFCEQRELLSRKGLRQGQTFSIDWHLFENGGMSVDHATERLFINTFGLYPLSFDDSHRALAYIFSNQLSNCIVVKGQAQKIFAKLGVNRQTDIAGIVNKSSRAVAVYSPDKVLSTVRKLIGKILLIDEHELSASDYFGDLGFESVSFTDFANELNLAFGTELMPAVFFEYQTIDSLVAHLVGLVAESGTLAVVPSAVSAELAKVSIQVPPEFTECPEPIGTEFLFADTVTSDEYDGAVAIIGMASAIPGCQDMEEFWRRLNDDKDLFTAFPNGRWPDMKEWKDRYPALRGAFLDNIEYFDESFFKISGQEARLLDPQQRILLELVWHAIEDAGYAPSTLAGSDTSVFVGIATSDYNHLIRKLGKEDSFYSVTGNSHAIAANRISHFFDFKGQSEPVNTACSSVLVAMEKAVSAIAAGNCELAVVGGVNIILDPSTYVGFEEAGLVSTNGQGNGFLQDTANGYTRAEGGGALLLKSFKRANQDGDNILAVVKCCGVNNNGRTNTLTAPNTAAQFELLNGLYEKHAIEPSTIQYFEMHGIGMKMADAIEFNTISKVFSGFEQSANTERVDKTCIVGSAKSRFGHLEAGSGILSLLKILLGFRFGKLPGSGCSAITNDIIIDKSSRLSVTSQALDWPKNYNERGIEIPRRAAVSSFGFGGVNAHMILDDFRIKRPLTAQHSLPNIFVLSARTKQALLALLEEYWLLLHRVPMPDLTELCFTLQTGRTAFSYRFGVVIDSIDSLREVLDTSIKNAKIDVNGDWCIQAKTDIAGYATGKGVVAETEAYKLTDKDLNAVLARWLIGNNIQWSSIFSYTNVKRVSIPGYPFVDKIRHFILDQNVSPGNIKTDRAGISSAHIKETIAEVFEVPIESIDDKQSLFDLGIDSLNGRRLAKALTAKCKRSVAIQELFECSCVEELSALLQG